MFEAIFAVNFVEKVINSVASAGRDRRSPSSSSSAVADVLSVWFPCLLWRLAVQRQDGPLGEFWFTLRTEKQHGLYAVMTIISNIIKKFSLKKQIMQ